MKPLRPRKKCPLLRNEKPHCLTRVEGEEGLAKEEGGEALAAEYKTEIGNKGGTEIAEEEGAIIRTIINKGVQVDTTVKEEMEGAVDTIVQAAVIVEGVGVGVGAIIADRTVGEDEEGAISITIESLALWEKF